jgi:hypothetical protein
VGLCLVAIEVVRVAVGGAATRSQVAGGWQVGSDGAAC